MQLTVLSSVKFHTLYVAFHTAAPSRKYYVQPHNQYKNKSKGFRRHKSAKVRSDKREKVLVWNEVKLKAG